MVAPCSGPFTYVMRMGAAPYVRMDELERTINARVELCVFDDEDDWAIHKIGRSMRGVRVMELTTDEDPPSLDCVELRKAGEERAVFCKVFMSSTKSPCLGACDAMANPQANPIMHAMTMSPCWRIQ